MAKKMQAAGGYDFGASPMVFPGWDPIKTSADETNATQTMSSISSLAMTVPAAGTYEFEYYIPYAMSVTGNGAAVDVTGPTTSLISFQTEIQTNTTAFRKDHRTAFSSSASVTSTGAANQTFGIRVQGRFVATASGTITPRYALQGATAATMTVRTGAYGKLRCVA